MCNGIRNSPIDIDFDTTAGMWMEEQQSSAFSSPLKFTGYGSVRYTEVRNDVEHLGTQDLESRANKVSNKGGHTAVSPFNEGLILTNFEILLAN